MKSFIKILAVAVIFALLASCGAQKTIKIGFMGTVSGASNDLSLNGLHGASIAIQKINDAGGINGQLIELVVKDTINDRTITKRAIDEFIREDIDIVIGEFTSSLMETALEHDVDQKILFLSPTASSGYFSGKDDNMIRFIGETEKQGSILVGQAVKNNDMKFIVIKDGVNRAFVDATSEEFITVIENRGGKVLEEAILDYTSLLRSTEFITNLMIKYPEADAVLLLLDSVNSTILIQSMDEIGWDPGIYTSFWVNTGDFYKLGSHYTEGVYTVGFVEEGVENESRDEFENSYYRHFGTKPSFPAYFAYDAVMALKEALEEKNRINKNAVKQFIINKEVYYGTAGNYTINEYGDCSREYKSFIVMNGQIVEFNID